MVEAPRFSLIDLARYLKGERSPEQVRPELRQIYRRALRLTRNHGRPIAGPLKQLGVEISDPDHAPVRVFISSTTARGYPGEVDIQVERINTFLRVTKGLDGAISGSIFQRGQGSKHLANLGDANQYLEVIDRVEQQLKASQPA